MTYPNDNWKGGAICTVSGTIAQVAGVPDPMGFNVTVPEGTEMEIISMYLKVGLVGAARGVTMDVDDSGGNVVISFMSLSMDDNYTYRGPIMKTIPDDQTADHSSTLGFPIMPFPLGGGERIRVRMAAAANGETWTVMFRFRIRGSVPTLAAIGTGISVANLTVAVI